MEKQKQLVVNLEDLEPTDVEFELSQYPGKKFTLGAYTLRVQLWAAKTFGKEQLHQALIDRDAEILASLAYHVLKEKDLFKTYDEFLEGIRNFKDRSTLLNAILGTVGMSQPIMEKLAAQLEGNEPAPSEKLTGANSTTQSPVNTPGVPLSDS